MLKIMKVKRDDLLVGDLVLAENGQVAYMILRFSRTLIHGHVQLHVRYDNNAADCYKTWLLEELSAVKTVCRVVK